MQNFNVSAICLRDTIRIEAALLGFEKAAYRSAPKVAFALELEYKNEKTELYEADESVKTYPSPIRFDVLHCSEIYTCSGDGVEEYAPSFTYFGMRYCFVSGIAEEQATGDLITFEVMSSDLQERGSFSCSDSIINRLIKACFAYPRAGWCVRGSPMQPAP